MKALALLVILSGSAHAAASLVTGGAQPASGVQVFSSFSASSGTITGANCAAGETAFSVAGSTFVVKCSGRVGIGTNAPGRVLDVNGDSVFRGSVFDVASTSVSFSRVTGAYDAKFVSKDNQALVYVRSGSAGDIAGVEFDIADTAAAAGSAAIAHKNGNLNFITTSGSGGTPIVSMTAGGDMSIGVDLTPDAQLEILSTKAPSSYVLSVSSQSDVLGSLMGVTGAGVVVHSSTSYMGVGLGSGTQLYYCLGGTFAGNVGRGASTICTAGTATPLGIWVP